MVEPLRDIAEKFPLPWSHDTRLLRLQSGYAVEFYQRRSRARRLDGEATGTAMNSQFDERTACRETKR